MSVINYYSLQPAFCHALCNLVQCVFNTPEPWTEASDSRTIGRQTGHHTLEETYKNACYVNGKPDFNVTMLGFTGG
ncbi:unnamed protein product [Dicrocoelium dendriticum]|nr:unnamed protein product [Dicrocoelium dendriticum]